MLTELNLNLDLMNFETFNINKIYSKIIISLENMVLFVEWFIIFKGNKTPLLGRKEISLSPIKNILKFFFDFLDEFGGCDIYCLDMKL